MSSTAATAAAMAPVGVGSKGKNSTAEIVAASMVGTAIELGGQDAKIIFCDILPPLS